MARSAKDAKLSTRTERLRLPPRREPYFRTIQEGRALGYRRIEGKGGTWTARAYDPATRRREYRSLGAADDFMDADGVECLTFAQAQEAARAWFASLARRRAGQGEEAEPPATVAQAVEEYSGLR